ncbi:hypothetical protein JCM10207_008623 [Rhodosporidiobolus poonsookiae]
MPGYAGPGLAIAGIPQTSFWENRKAFVLALCVAVGSFQYNLDTTIINGFQAMQGFLRVFGDPSPTGNGKYVIETVFQQLITSLLQVGLITASAAIGPFSQIWGRRAGFFVASVIGCIALLIQLFVTTRPPIYVGRWLLGVSNGALVNLVVLWISESSPAHLRGSFVSSFQVFQGIGGIIGAVVSKAFVNNLTRHSYQYQLIILFAVPAWLMVYSVTYMPESPRWLATKGREAEAARSLRRIRGDEYKEEYLQIELEGIKSAIEAEKKASEGAKFLDIFKGTDLRRTILATCTVTMHASSGINFLVGYGTVFFQIAAPGSDAFRNTIILQVCGFAGAVAAPFLARYVGRKTLLATSFGISTVCFLIVGTLNEVYPTSGGGTKNMASGQTLVAMVCIFQAAYNISIGPLAWAAGAEIPSNRLRSLTFSFSMSVGFVAAWLTVFTTPRYLNILGPRVAWIWMPSCLISFLWIIFFLPETNGRTLEELDEMFENRVPAWKFKSYICTGTNIKAARDNGSTEKDLDKAEESREEDIGATAVLERRHDPRKAEYERMRAWEDGLLNGLLNKVYYNSLLPEQHLHVHNQVVCLQEDVFGVTDGNREALKTWLLLPPCFDIRTLAELPNIARFRLMLPSTLAPTGDQGPRYLRFAASPPRRLPVVPSLGTVHAGLMRDRMAQMYGFSSAAHWARQW